MYCKRCGQQLSDGTNFCPQCGLAQVPVSAFGSTMVRPRDGRIFAGVCAAFSLRYGWDLAATRILTVLAGVFVFPLGEIAYLCGWLLIPEAPTALRGQ
jgi:phage shock protein C